MVGVVVPVNVKKLTVIGGHTLCSCKNPGGPVYMGSITFSSHHWSVVRFACGLRMATEEPPQSNHANADSEHNSNHYRYDTSCT